MVFFRILWFISAVAVVIFKIRNQKLFIIGCGMTTSSHNLMNSQINIKWNWEGNERNNNMANTRDTLNRHLYVCECVCMYRRIDCYFGILGILNGTVCWIVFFSPLSIYLNKTFGVSNSQNYTYIYFIILRYFTVSSIVISSSLLWALTKLAKISQLQKKTTHKISYLIVLKNGYLI